MEVEMELNEKLALIEEVLEVDKGVLNENSILGEQGDWDSLTQLSLVVTIRTKFNKELTGSQIRNMVTVQDILSYME
jgi:acyl carrier protein